MPWVVLITMLVITSTTLLPANAITIDDLCREEEARNPQNKELVDGCKKMQESQAKALQNQKAREKKEQERADELGRTKK